MYKRILPTGLLVLAAVVLLLGLAACDETAAANEYSQNLNNSEEQPLPPEMTTSGEEMLSDDVLPSGEIVTSGDEMSLGEGYGKGGRGQGRAQNKRDGNGSSERDGAGRNHLWSRQFPG